MRVVRSGNVRDPAQTVFPQREMDAGVVFALRPPPLVALNHELNCLFESLSPSPVTWEAGPESGIHWRRRIPWILPSVYIASRMPMGLVLVRGVAALKNPCSARRYIYIPSFYRWPFSHLLLHSTTTYILLILPSSMLLCHLTRCTLRPLFSRPF